MTADGTAKDDVKVPDGDLGKQIQGDFDEGKDLLVTIISAMGEEQVSFFFRAYLPFLSHPCRTRSKHADVLFCTGYFLQGSPQGCLNAFTITVRPPSPSLASKKSNQLFISITALFLIRISDRIHHRTLSSIRSRVSSSSSFIPSILLY